MNASHDRVMHYHGDASPFGGVLTHPFDRIIPSHASSSLSQAGGHAAARIDCFHLDDMIHTGAAYSRVTGAVEKRNRNWTTLVTSVVEDVDVMQVVTCDRITSQIAVEHPHDGNFPKVSFAGSQFHNLRINGRLVEPHLDHHFLSSPHIDSAHHSGPEGDILQPASAATLLEFPGKPWPEVESFAAKAADQKRKLTSAPGAPDWIKSRYKQAPASAKHSTSHIHCSLVHGVSGSAPCPSYGHIIHVHGFGNVFLAELHVAHHSFRLTMMRIEMGCLAEGTVSFSSGGANGQTIPPSFD